MSAGDLPIPSAPRSIRRRLQREGYRFDFYQAVRLLEMLDRTKVSPGAGGNPAAEAVRFRSRVSLEFPASDVHEIRFPSTAAGHSRPEMTVNFLGLAGLLGPLPMPLTEMILDSPRPELYLDENGEPRRDPPPAQDFLDIFNHRLISLMYRVRQAHRPALTSQRPDEGPVARCLFSLMGLGQPSMREQLGVPARALLYYSGLLAQRPRSVIGLSRMLADYFEVPVKIRQFVGRWRELDAAQWTVLGGPHGRNQRLGKTAVAGTRVWDTQTHIRVKLGPLSRNQFLQLLPEPGILDALRRSLTDFLRLPAHRADTTPLRDALQAYLDALPEQEATPERSALSQLAELAAQRPVTARLRNVASDVLKTLPPEGAHHRLCALIRLYLAPEFTFSLVLVLRGQEAFFSPLGSQTLRLGFTSWLSPAAAEGGDLNVRIGGSPPYA